ncbi:MAG: alpha/beta fold hydrolase [Pseudomonadales bacterium]|jgi:4,5:9,10-diseco-3-hydroxy-5,9,17-trioxoandrosta-1(10),2-diene-4-oate hydrolase|nr:alpha/beta fold hydrolase [Gammaproteobacteria bacterium]MBP6053306.1 alpha/beta fold hydrolase [Pseudomonadales bacterium]MBK6584144.1 alpha/beta fold hydrolase [Gammaproteobacteria bacterium]MBK7168607.1 alpha/beta fold hydrolase [Gammaproteobacteria bacterium]MBK7520328.1 alpha/beta fold hydrolase [Gammaproteobacteria bacterium]
MSVLPKGKFAACANGYRMHYLDVGAGPVVVFLHGSGPGASGHSNFQGNYPYLVERGFRCIVVDHIGYGFSDKPADVEYPLAFFTECLRQTLAAAGVSNCSLVGNSLGGAIALQFALDYPQLTERLVLMAPGGLNAKEEYFRMPGMQKMAQVFSSGQAVTPAVMKELFAGSLMHDPRYATDALIAERTEIMQLMNAQVMATMKVPELTDRLPGIKAPVLAFWGMNERMMPESGIMKLARNTPDIRLVLVSNCGHWVMVEHQDMFNRMTHDFLAHGT